MLARMPSILRAIAMTMLAAALAWAGDATARSAKVRIARVESPVAVLEDVRMRLDWPEGAREGSLHLEARRMRAPDLGYRFERMQWTCSLRRSGWSEWRCAGPMRTPQGAASLSVRIHEHGLEGTLQRGRSRVDVQRRTREPDLTRIDLASIPLAWTQALLARAWPEAQLKGGEGDARLRVTAGRGAVRIAGPLDLRGISLDTPDGRIAADGMDASLALDMQLGDTDRVHLSGRVGGGEALFGTAYLALQDRKAALELEALQQGACCWRIPRFEWRDGDALHAAGALAFGADGEVRALEVDAGSGDLARLRDAYLGGWLGAAGLGELDMKGGFDGRLVLRDGGLQGVDARLRGVQLRDPQGRFAFEDVDGTVRFSAGAPVEGELHLAGGNVWGLAFGPARVPVRSADGELALRAPVDIPMLGGRLAFDHVSIRPAAAGRPAEAAFGLTLERLDVEQLTRALGWPAFTGELSGTIPRAHFANDRLVFDGGLAMQVFGGRVDVSSLAMERPFGVAPTLSSDIVVDDLDLEALTGVLGFGSITGRLDGRIAGLRLVDWQPTAFDASLRTDRKRGVRQRISQRAVQDLSSVGDASFVTSLQSRLIGLFDDFGYARIGIDCRLADNVCDMGGLEARGEDAFLVVAGAGLPHLTVVGINRRVDWPTLVERLVAVGKGDAKPVVD
jgi:hypothetical protein